MKQARAEAIAAFRVLSVMGGIMALVATPFGVVYVALHFVIKNW